MLTIGQLASYAGVTVRAVRHYHAKGLLPEPERDHSGYRRYDAKAVVDLIKIRTLATAGVPLARVQELLHADEDEFAASVDELDRQLRQRRDLPRNLAQLLLHTREKLVVRACAASTLHLDAHLPSWTLGYLMIGLPLLAFQR